MVPYCDIHPIQRSSGLAAAYQGQVQHIPQPEALTPLPPTPGYSADSVSASEMGNLHPYEAAYASHEPYFTKSVEAYWKNISYSREFIAFAKQRKYQKIKISDVYHNWCAQNPDKSINVRTIHRNIAAWNQLSGDEYIGRKEPRTNTNWVPFLELARKHPNDHIDDLLGLYDGPMSKDIATLWIRYDCEANRTLYHEQGENFHEFVWASKLDPDCGAEYQWWQPEQFAVQWNGINSHDPDKQISAVLAKRLV